MRNAAAFWNELGSYGDAIALVDASGTISYRRLVEECDRIAPQLRSDTRQLVLIGLDTSAGSIIHYLAALRSGHAVLVADHKDEALWSRLCDVYAPELTIRAPYFDVRKQGDARKASDTPHPDLALMLTTSGSTGGFKCVRLTAEGVHQNACAIAKYLELTRSDRALLTLPIHYSYGLSVLHSHLAAGASMVVGLHSMATSSFLDDLVTYGATSFAAVPYSFEMLERMHFRDRVFPALKYVTQAGGRLDPRTVAAYGEWAQRGGKRFVVMYGQTEAGPRISWLPPQFTTLYPESIGVAIPGGTLALKDESGAEIRASNVHGELVFRGPSVMMGYATTREDLVKGREVTELRTGDVGYANAEGLYFLVGRLARFAKLYGKRFSLDEAEQYLGTLGYSDSVCVSNDRSLYIVGVAAPLPEEIRRLFLQRFGLASNDVHGVQLQKLPRLSSGKPAYREILAKAESIAAPTRVTHAASRSEAVRGIFQRAFPNREIAQSDTFVRLGGGSLLYVTVSTALEKCLDGLPADWEARSIQELSSHDARPVDVSASHFRSMETSIVFRGIAPLLIVLYHVGLDSAAGGAYLLLIVLGLNFARFHRADVLSGDLRKIASSTTINVLLPYWLVVAAYQLQEGVLALPELILADNFLGGHTRTPFPTWFVQASVQSIAIACVLGCIPWLRRQFIRRPFEIAFCGFIVAVGSFLVSPALPVWSQNEWRLTWVIWLFALGIAVHECRTVQHRALLSAAIIAIVPWLLLDQSISRVLIVTAGTLALLWVQRFKIPAWAVTPLALLGSASLFIYMLHPIPVSKIPQLGWFTYGLDAAISAAIGLAGWAVYNWIACDALPLLRRGAAWLRDRLIKNGSM